MSKPLIPRNGAAIVDSAGRASREFHIFLLSLADAAGVDLSAELNEILRRIDALEGSSQSAAIRAVGSLVVRDGILSLIGDVDSPSGSSYYGSNAGGERGWWRVIDAIEAGTGLAKAVPTDGYNVLGELDDASQLPATADVNDAYLIDGDYWVWTGAEWDRAGPPSGEAILSLAELPATVGGTLQKITRDVYGRVSELAPAAIADLVDVSDDAPALGDLLQWDGAQWAPNSVELGVLNLDGGNASSVYGGTTAIDGGNA